MNILFPNGYKCLVCGCEIASDKKIGLCDKCLNNLPRINAPVCNKCGEPVNIDSKYCVHCKHEMPVFTKCFSPYVFDGEIIKLIHGLKYGNQKYLATTLGNMVVNSTLEHGINFDIVIPVPLSEKRFKERGFNQAELIANSFKAVGFEVCADVVVRQKHTLTQTSLTKSERKQNLVDAFTVLDKSKIKGKNILIVDDVYTTGATINSLSDVLKRSGAKNVYGVTVAHAMVK